MARRATGKVLERKRQNGTMYALRFTAGGERRYVTLGTTAEGWSRHRAEDELRHTMSDVERGIWQPPAPAVTGPLLDDQGVPTFHEYASAWFERQKLEGGRHGNGLAPKSVEDLEWQLTKHLLHATFRDKPLDQITVEDVNNFRTSKRAEASNIEAAKAKGKPIMEEYTDRRGRKHRRARRALSAGSINKFITTLAAILEDAVEAELVPRNVAHGRRRRLQTSTPRRAWIDRADHITALLDAAGQLDEDALFRKGQRRALLATLVFAGLRIGEALSLRWCDVDLARGVIRVHGTKTDAAERVVNLLPVLSDELGDYRARLLDPEPAALVFGTTTGRAHSKSNIRERVLHKAIALANKRLAKAGGEQLPDGLSHHSLRRTFASVLFAIGEAPPYVMQQMGHTTAGLTLGLYARAMERRDGEPERLKALVEGDIGTSADSADTESENESTDQQTEVPGLQAVS
jgi:integrase